MEAGYTACFSTEGDCRHDPFSERGLQGAHVARSHPVGICDLPTSVGRTVTSFGETLDPNHLLVDGAVDCDDDSFVAVEGYRSGRLEKLIVGHHLTLLHRPSIRPHGIGIFGDRRSSYNHDIQPWSLHVRRFPLVEIEANTLHAIGDGMDEFSNRGWFTY